MTAVHVYRIKQFKQIEFNFWQLAVVPAASERIYCFGICLSL